MPTGALRADLEPCGAGSDCASSVCHKPSPEAARALGVPAERLGGVCIRHDALPSAARPR